MYIQAKAKRDKYPHIALMVSSYAISATLLEDPKKKSKKEKRIRKCQTFPMPPAFECQVYGGIDPNSLDAIVALQNIQARIPPPGEIFNVSINRFGFQT